MGAAPGASERYTAESKPRRFSMRAFALCVSLVATVLGVSQGSALAKKPEDVFGGRVMMSDKPFPLEAKSANAYVAAVKKQSKDRFTEDKEKQQWKIYYAAFFKKPLNDLEVKVTTYDVTDGSQRFLDSWEEYLNDKNQRVITGNLKLKRQDGKLSPNSKIMIVFEDKQKRIIASASFYILGEGKKFSGKVEFSEEEAQGGERPEETAEDEAQKRADEKKPTPAPPPKKSK
jgi:hypothetical protein